MRRHWSVGLVTTKTAKPLVMLPVRYRREKRAIEFCNDLRGSMLPGCNFVPVVVDLRK